ncbi:MAG: hypothetical protein IJV91_02110, partial [Kiritimatiellae bacterium]|nr:hypothetical protein [Kiritimatiellia bacterium]
MLGCFSCENVEFAKCWAKRVLCDIIHGTSLNGVGDSCPQKAKEEAVKDLKEAYKTIEADHFAPRMEVSFIDGDKRETLSYEKVTWNIGGEEKGLRYGENPGQEAALYKLVNGNLVLGEVEMLGANQPLASIPELLQSGKHPGKTNVTDADNALNILRYLMDKP